MNKYFEEYNNYIETLKLDKSPNTIRLYRNSIERFLDYFKIDSLESLREITPAQGRAYQGFLKESGLCEGSVNSNTRPLKAFFNFLITDENIEKNPWCKVKELKEVKKDPVFLSEDEIDQMISACKKEQDLLIISMMITLGLRREELITLKVTDIVNQHIIVHGKGKKERILPIPDDLYVLLQEHLLNREKKWGGKYDNIFISQLGRPFCGESIRSKIQSIGKKAKIPKERLEKIHPHSMRHTFTTNMIESGADIRIIQGALGHAYIQTTMKYAHLRNSALDKAILNQRNILKNI